MPCYADLPGLPRPCVFGVEVFPSADGVRAVDRNGFFGWEPEQLEVLVSLPRDRLSCRGRSSACGYALSLLRLLAASPNLATRVQGGLGPSFLRCRSTMIRSWNVLGGSADELCINACVRTPVASGAASDSITRSDAGFVSVLRRIRAMMGSSADNCLCRSRWGVASIVWPALIAEICSDSSETLGPSCFPGSWDAPERPALSWLVAQRGQFGQVGVVEEGLAQPGLVVAKLCFRDSEFSPDAVAFGTVAVGQSFQGVQDGPWPVVVAR